MGVSARAVWAIEQRLAAPPQLDEIARVAGVSRFHLCRVFAAAVGLSPIAYARRRRLSEAAKALALGVSVTEVAFGAGFESVEGFSRAFRDAFGLAPSALRPGGLAALPLLPPWLPEEKTMTELAPPRFETRAGFAVAGLRERFDDRSVAGIPGLWARLAPFLGAVRPAEPGVAYGVCDYDPATGLIDYAAGVAPAPGADLPEGFETVRLPAARYAVFTHRGHVSELRTTMQAIFDAWLPASGETAAESPDFERYDARFDPASGRGEVELWIPLK